MSEEVAIEQCGRCGIFAVSERHTCPERHSAEESMPARVEVLEPLQVFDRVRRRDPTSSAEWDLELLARWLPTIEGHAAALLRTSRSARDGRPDNVDERSHELARAIRVSARMASLDLGDRAVLWVAFVATGQQARMEVDAGREPFSRFDEKIGHMFVDRERRLWWLVNPATSQTRDAARRLGRELRERASKAYSGAGEATGDTGAWIARTRDHVSRLAKESIEAREAVVSPKVATGTRKERRRVLQTNSGNDGNDGNQEARRGDSGK